MTRYKVYVDISDEVEIEADHFSMEPDGRLVFYRNVGPVDGKASYRIVAAFKEWSHVIDLGFVPAESASETPPAKSAGYVRGKFKVK